MAIVSSSLIKLVSTIALFAAFCPAQAAIYRCGKVISDQPCGEDAKKIIGTSAPAAPSDPANEGADGSAICKNALLSQIQWDDKETLKFESISRGKWENIPWGAGKITSPTYHARISARNTHGIYGGAKVYTCYMNTGESKVLRISGS